MNVEIIVSDHLIDYRASLVFNRPFLKRLISGRMFDHMDISDPSIPMAIGLPGERMIVVNPAAMAEIRRSGASPQKFIPL